MSRIVVALALAFIAWPAFADELPVAISLGAIDGSPRVKSQKSSGGETWQMEWRKDDQERRLVLAVVEAKSGKKAFLKRDADDMHEAVFEEGLTRDRAEADVREEDEGELEIWDGEAEWVLGSELAERAPSFEAALAETANGGQASGKAPRGPERNYCVSFTWLANNKQRAMGGAYCRVFPAGQTPTAEAMLTALQLQFN